MTTAEKAPLLDRRGAEALRGGVVDKLMLKVDSPMVTRKLHTRRSLKPRRRKLRRSLTPAEASLWRALKNSQLSGRKFRRQHSVGKYVLDFYCVEEWLAIELD